MQGITGELGSFAALKNDNSVVVWGDASYGADSSSVDLTNISTIVATTSAYAALKLNGSVVTWGDANAGGDSTAFKSSLSDGVIKLCSTLTIIVALKSNGKVIAWGNGATGAGSLFENALDIQCTDSAVAVLIEGGSVVVTGESSAGGYFAPISNKVSSGVVKIQSNKIGFVAHKSTGQAVFWGNQAINESYSRYADYLKNISISDVERKDYFWKVNKNGHTFDIGIPEHDISSPSIIRLQK